MNKNLYKDYIKETYNRIYQTSHFNIKNVNDGKSKVSYGLTTTIVHTAIS